MKHMKKILFALAAVVTLGWIGATTASAQCSAAATAPNVRIEGTADLIGVITVTCGAGTLATPGSSIQVTISGGNVAPGAGVSIAQGTAAGPGLINASTTNTCGPTAPTNTSTFPCPAITPASAAATPFGVPPTVSTSGNTVTFANITPGAVAQVLVIGGIRINATGFAAGSSVLATVSYSGGFNPGSTSPSNIIIVATAQNAIARPASLWPVGTASFSNNLNILACAPQKPPSGSSVIGNPDATGFPNTRGINAVSGVAAAPGLWNAAAAEDNTTQTATVALAGFAIITAPAIATVSGIPTAGGIQGTRFMMTFTGVPNGIQIWIPQSITNAAAANGASAVSTGALTTIPVAATPGRITLVGGAAADGSGGGMTADIKDQFVPATVSGGTATVVYEVAQGPLSAFTINVVFMGVAPADISVINIATGVGPVGPPTAAAARPQFAAAPAGIEIAETRPCVTTLLFPWVVNTNDGNFDTGLAINNASADPFNTGTSPLKITGIAGAVQTPGDVTLFFFPAAGGTAPASLKLTPSPLPAGQTATFVASSLKTSFIGYVIAVCNFAWGHGFAFIDNPIAGQNGFAQGYTANVLPSRRNVVPESVGQ